MNVPVAITPQDLYTFLVLALFGGVLGGFLYRLLADVYSFLSDIADQRQRERAFLADLAEIPTGDRWHG